MSQPDISPNTLTLPLDEVIGVALRAFRAIGFNRQEAFDSVRNLLYGALRGGKNYHGFDRFPWIARQVGKTFVPGRAMTVEHADAERSFLRLQGNKGLGYTQIYAALLHAEAALKDRNVVHIGLIDSYPTNCMGDYAAILANMGFCAYLGTVSPNRVAWPGSPVPKLSTSGQAFAFPGDPPVVLDFAVGATTNGDIVYHKKHGLPLPTDCCLDGDGNPTTDPGAVVDDNGAMIGSILPRGGASAGTILGGMGVVMMIHALEVGIDYGGKGTFIMARRPLPGTKDAIEAFRTSFAGGESDVHLPGAHGGQRADRALDRGLLDIERQIWDGVATTADGIEADPTDAADGDEMLRQLHKNTYRLLEPATIAPFSGD